MMCIARTFDMISMNFFHYDMFYFQAFSYALLLLCFF